MGFLRREEGESWRCGVRDMMVVEVMATAVVELVEGIDG